MRAALTFLGWTLFAVVLILGCVAGLIAWYVLYVPGQPHRGPLPPLTAEERDISARLKRHIEAIADVPHNLAHSADLEKAAQYIEATLAGDGYVVERQVYDTQGQAVRNIWVTVEPPAGKNESGALVIGAHYDSAGDAPGADDNGTGTAAVLELGRLLKGVPIQRRIYLVLFPNEENPYFGTAYQGSFQFAELLEKLKEPVHGMISLETIGTFSDAPNSQRYPQPLKPFFPATANFIAFVAMPGSRRLMHESIGAFRKSCAFPTVGGVAPAFVQGIAASDHAAFAERGIPAIMITDTAYFRYPHYHLPSDTPDKVHYEKLGRIPSASRAPSLSWHDNGLARRVLDAGLAMLIAAALTAFAVLLVVFLAHYAIVFPRQPYKGPAPPLNPEERKTVPRLKAHVRAVAGRPHNLDHYADLLSKPAIP